MALLDRRMRSALLVVAALVSSMTLAVPAAAHAQQSPTAPAVTVTPTELEVTESFDRPPQAESRAATCRDAQPTCHGTARRGAGRLR